MVQIVHSTSALGHVLKDARRRHRLTQAALAERAGVTQATVSKIERDIAPPGLDTILKLAAVLGLELVVRPKPEALPPAPWEED